MQSELLKIGESRVNSVAFIALVERKVICYKSGSKKTKKLLRAFKKQNFSLLKV